ncbi:telomeric repeat-binding factor 1 isoform X2 [Denticeps clupeoides]|uniref:telomeric repeat-binding factor 1 isoform X2 n=1 Tax=Denticeps clupeoides TaxID=299321 RepID=UPI0010A3ADD1|nr:telomeric repeat-binding factor 1 isoform X2 [Denticeps clupeoides]
MDGDASPAATPDAPVPFSDAQKVVRAWMVDFLFLSASHCFREGNSEEFGRTVRSFAALTDGCPLEDHQIKKKTVSGFLARIMDGRNLDVNYDQDIAVTPLMSAVSMWETMKDMVDPSLHLKIKQLLCVQSVGVCLEKGRSSLAIKTLAWLEKECELPQKLQMKLSSVVNKREVYNQFFSSFSFKRLLDCVQAFLDSFLQENPSGFLIKAATKVVQAQQERGEQMQPAEEQEATSTSSEDQPSASPSNKDPDLSSQTERRPKRMLYTTCLQPWKPETEATRLFYGRKKTSKPDNTQITKKKKWSFEEDQQLKAGVKRYGVGNWARILQEFNFEHRTGVMLKDRWRTMSRLNIV